MASAYRVRSAGSAIFATPVEHPSLAGLTHKGPLVGTLLRISARTDSGPSVRTWSINSCKAPGGRTSKTRGPDSQGGWA